MTKARIASLTTPTQRETLSTACAAMRATGDASLKPLADLTEGLDPRLGLAHAAKEIGEALWKDVTADSPRISSERRSALWTALRAIAKAGPLFDDFDTRK